MEAEVCGPAEPSLLSFLPSSHSRTPKTAAQQRYPWNLGDPGLSSEGFGVLPGQQQHMNAERQE